MNVKQPFSWVYQRLWTHNNRTRVRKIMHGYYIKNWVECRHNKELLKEARRNFEDDLSNNPLISVIIPTYNRAELLVRQAIPSVLKQTYRNFELIIVGDHCTDDTEQRVKEFKDDRIKFVNLPERGKYPERPWDGWMVAGSIPRNAGLELASGKWIAPLDDDDEFSEDHLETLLSHAVQSHYEMVYGVIQMEMEPGKWINCGSLPLRFRHICHQSVLYHSKLKFLKYNVNAWKYNEPDDWNLWRRMKEAGVRIGFIDRIVGKHYLETTQWAVQRRAISINAE